MVNSSALVILCGGRSTRMGCNKAFLPFGDMGLLEYQVERFSGLFPKIYASIPNEEASHFHEYDGVSGCTVIADQVADYGPMGGMASCFAQTTEEILFFISVDAPFVSPVHARKIIQELTEQRERDLCEGKPLHTICAVSRIGGKKETLFAAYHRDVVKSVDYCMSAHRLALRALHDREEVLYLTDMFFPVNHFYNMNDRQKYYRALELLREKNDRGQEIGTNIPVITFCAKSGTGKTTYLERLLPLLKEQGLRLAVIKHDAHRFEMDKPGKDSYRLTKAGADHMILTSEDQTAVIIQHSGQGRSLEELLSKVENVDLIITEGYKQEKNKKIELLRAGYNEVLRSNQEQLIAVVADFPFETNLPVFDLNRPEDMVDFLLEYIRASVTDEK